MTVKQLQKARSEAKKKHKHLLVSLIAYWQRVYPNAEIQDIAERFEIQGVERMSGGTKWTRGTVSHLRASEEMLKADPEFARSFLKLYPDSSGFLPNP